MDQQQQNAQRSVERGGLPSEQEQASVYRLLMNARDELEAITWRVQGVTEATHSNELPRPATFSDIGVVSVIADDADRFGDELRQFARQLRETIGVLDTLRDTPDSATSTGERD